MNVRPADSGDIAALTDLIFRSKASNGYDDDFMEACREELRITPDKLREAEYWVAEDDSLAGCVALTVTGQEAEVENFFVAPERQRQGVGRLLWDRVMDRVAALQIMRLTLDADPNAVPFYEAMGFRTYAESPSGSIPGRMLPKMELLVQLNT